MYHHASIFQLCQTSTQPVNHNYLPDTADWHWLRSLLMSTRLTNTADKPNTLPHVTIASTCLFNGPFPLLISTTKSNLKTIYHCLLLPPVRRRPDKMKGPSMIHLLQSHLLQSCLLQSLLSLSSHPKPIPPHLSSKAWSSQHLLPKNLPHLAPAC